MPKLILIKSKDLCRLLEKEGFVCIRVRGSHHFYQNRDTGKTTTIPVHANSDISIGLLRQILRDIHYSVEEFEIKRRQL